MEKYTPMMQQYLKTKAEYRDSILFYRLGDFYEMFFDDAILVSRELELVLTGKSCGVEEKAPMCGVPFHSAEGYIAKLVEKGFKVAICEQTEDPKAAKGLVKREVVRLVTPGTYLEEGKEASTFIACIITLETTGMAFCDVGTGEFFLIEAGESERVEELLSKYEPREIVCNDGFLMSEPGGNLSRGQSKSAVFSLENIIDGKTEATEYLRDHFGDINALEGDYEMAALAGANLLAYLLENAKGELPHINKLKVIDSGKHLLIDRFSFRNLELLNPMRRDDKKGCLLYVLDKTQTAMGRRLLSSFIRSPLREEDKINARLDAVEELSLDGILSAELREYLKSVYDIERLISKISYRSVNPKDLLALKKSLQTLPHIKTVMGELKSGELTRIREDMDGLEDIFGLLNSAIDEEAPISLHDGYIIRTGYNERVDSLRKASTEGKSLLSELEERERELTGIKNLKVRYNRVFGYYIEVTNSNLSQVPDRYIRRQTLANGERFFTEELKALEDDVLGAREKLNRLEYDLFREVVDVILQNERRIQKSAELIAGLDVYLALSEVAVRNSYVRPSINNKGYIEIKDGRHPVVEMMQYPERFIENDTHLDCEGNQIYLITGPNMAGKSTYMRQCALIVLMAHMGSFVPASSADICIVDRIFTRVGASDDLSSGQSTFMVEMSEMAHILMNATKDSLIILDEIGRGTSTYDGLSIAWAVVEHIADKKKLGAKTLFATHYHELTKLSESLEGVKNYSCAVSEKDDSIVFLRKIIDQAADRSYGIQVAALAGVPAEVTNRAKEILEEIVSGLGSEPVKVPESNPVQLSFFNADEDALRIKEAISGFDTDNATPLNALSFISELKEKYKL